MPHAPSQPANTAPTWDIQGRRVTMPVEVRDASNGVAIFMVPAAQAQALLPDATFEIEADADGQAQLVLGLVDYRDNDLGDYNEIAMVLFVRPHGGAPDTSGTYIYKLPVDQSFTCEAGARIWGFPKTVEEITYTYTDDCLSGKLVMDGQHVFTLTLPRGSAPETVAEPPMASITYTYIDGVAHRTRFTTGGNGTVVTAGAAGVTLTLGTHPIAEALRGLGLPSAPIMSSWTEHMRGTFDTPERM